MVDDTPIENVESESWCSVSVLFGFSATAIVIMQLL